MTQIFRKALTVQPLTDVQKHVQSVSHSSHILTSSGLTCEASRGARFIGTTQCKREWSMSVKSIDAVIHLAFIAIAFNICQHLG